MNMKLLNVWEELELLNVFGELEFKLTKKYMESKTHENWNKLAAVRKVGIQIAERKIEPMFPQGWDDDSKWPEMDYNYDTFRIHQMQIDEQNEKSNN